jgi:hypothetical protein
MKGLLIAIVTSMILLTGSAHAGPKVFNKAGNSDRSVMIKSHSCSCAI